jgi:hypothetical protein
VNTESEVTLTALHAALERLTARVVRLEATSELARDLRDVIERVDRLDARLVERLRGLEDRQRELAQALARLAARDASAPGAAG